MRAPWAHARLRRGLAQVLATADQEVMVEAENVAEATAFLKKGVNPRSPAD